LLLPNLEDKTLLPAERIAGQANGGDSDMTI